MRTTRSGKNTVRKELTEDQIARLDAIGMIWDNKYERQWNAAFQALCEYHQKNGSFEMPVSYKTESGIALGKWVRRQRDFYDQGKLTYDRVEKLRGIGFTLEKIDPWEEKYQIAKAYFEEHGDLNVPVEYIVNGVWLNKWLNEQKIIGEGRRKNKSLTDEQKSRLAAIGMQFGVTKVERLWQQNYEELKRFYDENGHINVPKNHLTSDGKKLNVWIIRQRKARQDGLLSDERIRLLDELGMEWRNIADASYETGFEHLKEYISEHGSDNIPLNAESKDEYKLGRWIANCKSKFKAGTLKKEYCDRFAEHGIMLDSEKADTWEMRFQEVKKYFAEHNVHTLPKDYPSKDGTNLWQWLEDQKKYYRKGTLSPERKAKFDEMGYPFRSERRTRKDADFKIWLKKYEIIKEYSTAHPGETIGKDFVYKGVHIISWLNNQRQRCKKGLVDDKRLVLLRELRVNSYRFD